MKTRFSEFYTENKVNFSHLTEKTAIVFDTNTLLNIYRYSESTKEEFLSILEKLQERIWIPYQVGLEFNLNRRTVMDDVNIKKSKSTKDVYGELEKFKNLFESRINQYPIRSLDGNELKQEIKSEFDVIIDEFIEKLKSNYLLKLDELMEHGEDGLDKMASILEGRIGDPFTQSELDEIFKEGEYRYKHNIPPGYEDDNSKNKDITHFNGLKIPNKYGDLIIWKEVIRLAQNQNLDTVVIVTDDTKEDWWYRTRGKTIGPRAELKNELLRESDAKLVLMNVNKFLSENGSEILVMNDEVNAIGKNNSDMVNKNFEEILKEFELARDLREENKDAKNNNNTYKEILNDIREDIMTEIFRVTSFLISVKDSKDKDEYIIYKLKSNLTQLEDLRSEIFTYTEEMIVSYVTLDKLSHEFEKIVEDNIRLKNLWRSIF